MWRYYPEFFAAQNIQQAKEIILTGTNTNNKWQQETTQLTDKLIKEIPITEKSVVLDYGCGIGRISKELIEQTGCTVIGVDVSPNMLALSFDYVMSPNFTPCSLKNLSVLVRSGLKFDVAFAILVLQHCAEPQTDIKSIHRALKTNGYIYLLNEKNRCVPIFNETTREQNWSIDNVDIHKLLADRFTGVKDISIADMNPHTISRLYQKTRTKRNK